MSILRLKSSPVFLESYTNEHGVTINVGSMWDYDGSLNTFMDKVPVNKLEVVSIEKVGSDIKVSFDRVMPFNWVDASYFDGKIFTKV